MEERFSKESRIKLLGLVTKSEKNEKKIAMLRRDFEELSELVLLHSKEIEDDIEIQRLKEEISSHKKALKNYDMRLQSIG